MPNLTDNTVSQLFTIPASDWTAIDRRVGLVVCAQQMQGIISQVLPDYPALLACCVLWEQSTFDGLINQSGALEQYANKAIGNFSDLNRSVKGLVNSGSSTVPDNLKLQTTLLLNMLAKDTAAMASDANQLSAQVLSFLNENKKVDAQLMARKLSLPGFQLEPLVSNMVNSFEDAAGLVTGAWRAITDDLNNTLVSPVDVTLPFLESLGIDAAIISWQNIQTEAHAFPQMINGQKQYWVNPF